MPQENLNLPLTHSSATALSKTAVWHAALMLSGIAFMACMFGIASRPWGMLSSFWIANGLMIGLMVRVPAFRKPLSWGLSFVAFLLADLLTGAPFGKALWLTASNYAGIGLGVWLLLRQSESVLRLQSEQGVVAVAIALFCASAASTVLGAPAGMVFFQMGILKAASLWLTTEFMNHLLIVPLVLSYARPDWDKLAPASTQRNWLPMVALFASEMAASLIGGPGAIAFTLPAFLWIALTYSLFSTAVLFTLFSLWKCFAFSIGHMSASPEMFGDMVSLRMGLSLLWLGPLSVACSHAARNAVLRKLDHASQHDLLTDTLVRGALMRHGERLLSRLRHEKACLVVLMLDIDHFKRVNDQYGHAMGDEVLRSFARTIKDSLRATDFVARLGGEEFAILLPRLHYQEAQEVGQRLAEAVRQLRFTSLDGVPFAVTASLGLTHYDAQSLPLTLDAALAEADRLLYQAKHAGRDQLISQTVASDEPPAPPVQPLSLNHLPR